MKKWLPSREKIEQSPSLKFLQNWLMRDHLWHPERHAVAKGLFIGLFLCMMPMPFQMIPAALLCIMLRANILFAIGGVWISNPITMGPMMVGAYHFGAYVLNQPYTDFEFTLDLEHIVLQLGAIWEPLMTGCLILGISLGTAGYVITLLLWQFFTRGKKS